MSLVVCMIIPPTLICNSYISNITCAAKSRITDTLIENDTLLSLPPVNSVNRPVSVKTTSRLPCNITTSFTTTRDSMSLVSLMKYWSTTSAQWQRGRYALILSAYNGRQRIGAGEGNGNGRENLLYYSIYSHYSG